MTPQGRRAGIDVYRFVEDGKQLRGSNYGSATPAVDFPRIASLYAEGRLPLDLLVTERIGLEGVEGALDAMRRGDGATTRGRVLIGETKNPDLRPGLFAIGGGVDLGLAVASAVAVPSAIAVSRRRGTARGESLGLCGGSGFGPLGLRSCSCVRLLGPRGCLLGPGGQLVGRTHFLG